MKNWLKPVAVFGSLAALVAGGIALSPHHVGPANLYPDLSLTPGLVATTNLAEIKATSACGTYSTCHRNTTGAQKTAVCKEYPNNCTSTHEIDHFCPLALGCADDVKNLWAQPESNMWNGQDFGFHTKDRLETYLVIQVKKGAVSPTDAQQCILRDWVACYLKYLGNTPSYGAVGNTVDPDEDAVE